MNNFGNWLQGELDRQKIKAADLAREAGLSPSTISRLLKGEITEPTNEVLSRIAHGLGEPMEKILRAAGRLSATPAKEDPTIRDLIELAGLLPAEERLELLRYADYRYKRYREEHGQEGNDKPQSANAPS